MLKDIVSNVGPLLGRQFIRLKGAAPDILIFVGIGGVIGGTVWLMKRTKQGYEVLGVHEYDEAQLISKKQSMTEEEFRKEMRGLRFRTLKGLAKTYAGPVSVIAASVGGILYGRNLFKDRTLALMAANSVLQSKSDRLIDVLEEKIGKEETDKVKAGIIDAEYEVTEIDEKGKKRKVKKTGKVLVTASEYAQWFDEASCFFHKDSTLNRMTITQAQNNLTTRLHKRGYLFLDEAYRELDIHNPSPVFWKMAHTVGWVLGYGDNEVSFNVFEPDNANFINGYESRVLLDPNVDGDVYAIMDRIAKGGSV